MDRAIGTKKIFIKNEIERINRSAKRALKNNSDEYKTVIEKHKKAWKELANK